MGDRVIPIKIETIALGGGQDNTRYTPANINEDYLACRGIYFQKTAGADSNAYIERAAAGDTLSFHDSSGTYSLGRLATGSTWVKEAFNGFAYASLQLQNGDCASYIQALVIMNGLVLEEGVDYSWSNAYTIDLSVTVTTADRIVVIYPKV